MADPAADVDANGADAALEPGETEGMPGWVKVFVIIAMALALIFVAAKVTGIGGDHGPGRHGGGNTSPTSSTDHQSPIDHRP